MFNAESQTNTYNSNASKLSLRLCVSLLLLLLQIFATCRFRYVCIMMLNSKRSFNPMRAFAFNTFLVFTLDKWSVAINTSIETIVCYYVFVFRVSITFYGSVFVCYIQQVICRSSQRSAEHKRHTDAEPASNKTRFFGFFLFISVFYYLNLKSN